MGETKVRYRVVRVADKTDDQKTASAILNALASSITQEDLQEFILSQIKRIIFGDLPGNWFNDFEGAGILSLAEISPLLLTGGFELPANCLTTDSVGDIVRISGDSIGGIIQVTQTDITDYSKMPGVGVILSKSTPTDCKVLRYGMLNTTGLIPGRIYFVDTNSRLTAVRPISQLGVKVFVQTIGIAMDSSRLLVNPSFNLTRGFST
jgi:hypothetical protein